MRIKYLVIVIISFLCLCSCKSKNRKEVSKDTTSEASGQSVILPWELDSLMLSDQQLTSWTSVVKAFENGVEEDILNEPTPATSAFFEKESDITNSQLVLNVQRRYNYNAVLGRVVHAYEWFQRIASGTGPSEDGSPITKKDTLAWIKESQPNLSMSFVIKAVNFPSSQKAAKRLLEAYRGYDGSDRDDSEFAKAFKNYQDHFADVPDIVSESELEQFEKEFWGWYDKEQFVPGINDIILMHTYGYKGDLSFDEQYHYLLNAIKEEKDIDRRTIMALELVKFSEKIGAVFLGDILECGVYTRYLLEAWISWRANIQADSSPSSFSVIPNNYYDMLRVKCLNTFLRHLQNNPDDYRAKCLLENMLLCEGLHRTGSIIGNESTKTLTLLSYREFINPKLLSEEKE